MLDTDVAPFSVKLDTFSGPLDLLLYLVRRHEVDILDIPIAEIAAKFLEFLEVLQILDMDRPGPKEWSGTLGTRDNHLQTERSKVPDPSFGPSHMDLVGDFVVTASALVEIKSRMALPAAEEPAELVEPDEDPRADLVRQLLEYKRFKDACRLLEEHAADWQQRYPRLSDDRPKGGSDPAHDLIKEVELWDLVSALTRVLRKNSESSPATVVYDETPISVYIDRIRTRVVSEGVVTFSSFFTGTNSRSKIVGIFLAILELLRHYGFRAEQPLDNHEIWILPPLPGMERHGPPAEEPGSTEAAPNAPV